MLDLVRNLIFLKILKIVVGTFLFLSDERIFLFHTIVSRNFMNSYCIKYLSLSLSLVYSTERRQCERLILSHVAARCLCELGWYTAFILALVTIDVSHPISIVGLFTSSTRVTLHSSRIPHFAQGFVVNKLLRLIYRTRNLSYHWLCIGSV